jgi:activator of HSP90 ATPase
MYKKFSVCIALIAAIFILPSSAVAQNNTMTAHFNDADSVKGITIHQEIDFKASPQQVYETLLSSKQFSDCIKKSFPDFSATSANIDSAVGGTFSLFDGHIIGRILELVPNQRIVEAWRVADWPAGVYSIASFEFLPQGSGTKLVFNHVGFPEGLKEHLTVGWQQHYWDALAKYFQ